MKLALAGINHRTAPVQVRERLALRPDEIPAALLDMQARGAKEALVLSTCNRVEITAVLADSFSVDRLLEGILGNRPDLRWEEVRPHL